VDEKAVTKLGTFPPHPKAFRTCLATDIFYYFFFLIVISCKRSSEIGECPKEKNWGRLKALIFWACCQFIQTATSEKTSKSTQLLTSFGYLVWLGYLQTRFILFVCYKPSLNVCLFWLHGLDFSTNSFKCLRTLLPQLLEEDRLCLLYQE
jgi:hypothetical protein